MSEEGKTEGHSQKEMQRIEGEFSSCDRDEVKMLDPLDDGKSAITLIDWMGSDLSVVNDARASFDKESVSMCDRDKKLIEYLVEHHHSSPLRGVVFKFRVKAPLYVCRQWWKHVIASNHNDEQLGWNEKSLRYVEVDSPEFYIPTVFRKQAVSNRQSSEGEVEGTEKEKAYWIYVEECRRSWESYQQLLELGVCREQARGVLNPSIYTTWVWTASLQAVLHFLGLRQGNGAQSEIGQYANAIASLIQPIVPVTVEVWDKYKSSMYEE